MKRPWLLASLLLSAAAVLVVLLVRIVFSEPLEPRGPQIQSTRTSAQPRVEVSQQDKSRSRGRRVSRSERNQVHRKILDALAQRRQAEPAARQRRAHAGTETGQPSSSDPAEDPTSEGEEPSAIKNRFEAGDTWGNLVAGSLGTELGELADECVQNALDRQPGLQGMVEINFSVMGDEDIGGVIEEAELGPDNQVHDPGLAECLQESVLSMVLPPPEGSGRRGVRLTLPVGEGTPRD